jgi:hypothetical protein
MLLKQVVLFYKLSGMTRVVLGLIFTSMSVIGSVLIGF